MDGVADLATVSAQATERRVLPLWDVQSALVASCGRAKPGAMGTDPQTNHPNRRWICEKGKNPATIVYFRQDFAKHYLQVMATLDDVLVMFQQAKPAFRAG